MAKTEKPNMLTRLKKKMTQKGRDKYMIFRGNKENFVRNGAWLLEESIALFHGKANPVRHLSVDELNNMNVEPLPYREDKHYHLCQGSWEGRVVLVKKSHLDGFYQVDFFLREIVVATQMATHNNAHKILGCCLETDTPVVVYEWMPPNTLEDRICPNDANQSKAVLEWKDRLRIAWEISHVAAYLHTAFPRPIIHKGLTPYNVFLNQDNAVKLGDFSLCVSIPEGEEFIKDTLLGSMGYIAPEYFSTSKVAMYTDVYSFGMFLLVLLTGKRAYPFFESFERLEETTDSNPIITWVRNGVKNNHVNKIVDPTITRNGVTIIEDLQLRASAQLAIRCASSKEDCRPTMVEVATELKNMIRSLEIEGSGAHYAMSRRLNASVKRESCRSGITGAVLHHEQQCGSPNSWSGEHQSQGSRPMYSPGGLPTSDDEDEERASHDDRDEELDPQDYHTVYKGQHGRFASSQASQPTTSSAGTWLVQQTMPGGPEDGTVIPSFGGHVASYIWGGQERNVLPCLSRTQLCSELVNWRDRLLAQEHLELIDSSGLSHLPGIMFERLDWPLISAFVERWQPDTNTFHMPFGEITIMLHDVYHILGLRVDGSMVSATPSTDVIRDACLVTMDMTADELNEKCDTKTIWQDSGVLTERIFGTTLEAQRPFSVHYTAYMWLVLGGSLFLDKSGNRTHSSFLHELVVEGLSINEYSWGSATLAYLYRQLGTASRKDADSIAGCLTLLQAWIYEYFPCFRPQQGTLMRELNIPRASAWDVGSGCLNKSMERLLAFRARLDELTDREVNWLPYGVDPARHVPPTLFIGCIQYRSIIEPYMPNRVLRQLGFVQDIPKTIIRPEKAERPTNLKMYRVEFSTEMTSVMWTRFVPSSSFSVVLGTHTRLDRRAPTIAPGYMHWLHRFSHPRLSPRGLSVGSSSLPERNNTDYWISRSMEIHQRALDEYPNMSRETRAMTEQLIVDWKAMMGL